MNKPVPGVAGFESKFNGFTTASVIVFKHSNCLFDFSSVKYPGSAILSFGVAEPKAPVGSGQ